MLVQALAGSSVDSRVGTRKLDLLKMWIAEVLAHTFAGSSVVKHSLVQVLAQAFASSSVGSNIGNIIRQPSWAIMVMVPLSLSLSHHLLCNVHCPTAK